MTRLPPDLLALLEVAARHPAGLAPLLDGHLESVAALYQLHPDVVERIRDSLAAMGLQGRAAALALGVAPGHEVAGRAPATDAPDLEAVMRSALETPGGVELLLRAPVERAAVLLGAHPFVIDAARARFMVRRAITHEHPKFAPPRPSADRPQSQP